MNCDWQTFKNLVFKKSEDLIQISPITSKAKSGTLSKTELGDYLFNLARVFEETPKHLEKAAIHAERLGLPSLARFYTDKIAEEMGHDQWAKSDLRSHSSEDVAKYAVHPETLEILNYVDQVIDQDPRLYLAYISFVETLTIVAARGFLTDLEQKCSIPQTEVTAILNHEEKDRYHSAENFDFIETLVPENDLAATMESVVQHSYERVLKVMKACTQH